MTMESLKLSTSLKSFDHEVGDGETRHGKINDNYKDMNKVVDDYGKYIIKSKSYVRL